MDFTELVRTRRSLREYSDEPIDDTTLEQVFAKTAMAPSGYNLQPWEFLALREPESKKRLQEVAYGQEQVTDADTAVVVLGTTKPAAHAEAVFEDWVKKGYLPDKEAKARLIENVTGMRESSADNLRRWTTRSTALAAMTLMYAAWEEGIASCPMEGFDSEALVEEFDIPDEYEPIMLVTLGYPAADAKTLDRERKGRRPVDEILHFEEFEPAEATTLTLPLKD